MRSTADAEQARVAEDIDRRRDTHIAIIRLRRESEVQRMRELADADLQAIDGWAGAERQHIQLERERRAQSLQNDLETSLAEHGSKIDREIERVEAAIATHRALVDAFFATLGRESDPVAIAQHAARRPVFPALEAITDDSIVAEPTDTSGVGVMDPQSATSDAPGWLAWNAEPGVADPGQATEALAGTEPTASTESTASTEPTAIGDEVSTSTEQPEPVSVAAVAEEATASAILHSTPISRPMSWLRRDRDSGENGHKEK
jgi:hypothetical protein